jgi:hypothetical protein
MASDSNVPAGWLEVQDEADGSHVVVDCPRRGRVSRRECLGCAHCEGPAIDGSGKHVYVVCTCPAGGGPEAA